MLLEATTNMLNLVLGDGYCVIAIDLIENLICSITALVMQANIRLFLVFHTVTDVLYTQHTAMFLKIKRRKKIKSTSLVFMNSCSRFQSL